MSACKTFFTAEETAHLLLLQESQEATHPAEMEIAVSITK